MRESRTYGSVRGAPSDGRPYRDPEGQFVRSYGAAGKDGTIRLHTTNGTERLMTQPNDLSRSQAQLVQDKTLIAVIELSLSSWLVAGVVPGVDRQPLKKLEPDQAGLLRLLQRWRDEAMKAGCTIERIAVAYEAGRDGFWLARWLRGQGIEVHVIHSSSVAVSREHRRAKTDRLDTAMLLRVFMGWLRGERGHCGMVAVPTIEEEDAKRPHRERESLVGERTRIISRMKAALVRLGIRGFKPELRRAPKKLDRRRKPGRTRWCGCWPASSASVWKPRTCSFRRCCPATSATEGQWHATPA